MTVREAIYRSQNVTLAVKVLTLITPYASLIHPPPNPRLRQGLGPPHAAESESRKAISLSSKKRTL